MSIVNVANRRKPTQVSAKYTLRAIQDNTLPPFTWDKCHRRMEMVAKTRLAAKAGQGAVPRAGFVLPCSKLDNKRDSSWTEETGTQQEERTILLCGPCGGSIRVLV